MIRFKLLQAQVWLRISRALNRAHGFAILRGQNAVDSANIMLEKRKG